MKLFRKMGAASLLGALLVVTGATVASATTHTAILDEVTPHFNTLALIAIGLVGAVFAVKIIGTGVGMAAAWLKRSKG